MTETVEIPVYDWEKWMIFHVQDVAKKSDRGMEIKKVFLPESLELSVYHQFSNAATPGCWDMETIYDGDEPIATELKLLSIPVVFTDAIKEPNHLLVLGHVKVPEAKDGNYSSYKSTGNGLKEVPAGPFRDNGDE